MIELAAPGMSVVVDVTTGAPTIVYWGSDIGSGDIEALSRAHERPIAAASPDVVAPMSMVPEHGSGYPGRPGLSVHRAGGTHWSPRFAPTDHHRDHNRLIVNAIDHTAQIGLTTTIDLDHCLVATVTVTNLSERDHLIVDRVSITLPVPQYASELGTFTGRWTREFHPERRPWNQGTHLIENRHGRTSHEYPSLIFAGQAGYGEWHGNVWGAHLAWSGNHILVAERLPDGRRCLQLGELLHPSELCLGPGESTTTPEVIATHSSDGLTPATQRFHRHLRARPSHPHRPRPITLNTWEAVYFDHDLEVLTALADRAAAIGIERFVLDDGWFGSRRDDTSGLGDWTVSPDAHPLGLTPLIDHVTDCGMEFGLWIEPEMINPESDLYRAHPDWVLAAPGYEPPLARNQLVLDLGRPETFDHVFSQIDAILRDHDISYVKWDMNRDHIAASGSNGAAGTHRQTLAVYRLIDELRNRHPGVEFESCSSGGARIDFEMLRRTERVWTSDSNDAHDRQLIQRGASMLIPPEVMGAHIGPDRSHTTSRRHDLGFRAATAFFGHLGVEWNLLTLNEADLKDLADIISLHKRFRPLLHHGDLVRFDTDDHYVAHGVYSPNRTEGLVSFAVIETGPSLIPPPLRLPGLDDMVYRIDHLPIPGWRLGPATTHPGWFATGIEMTGRQLACHGLQLPVMHPDTAVILHLSALDVPHLTNHD
ncbi:MAG: alpha-galactosidase [Ilumatobacter coccineus]|uniref:Alpha-galactosidase n=1 Tax=Ilumatobacter coccineus TaxID=467094 RepID=A0A2G6KB53_9ACTN|nr:MAG: alpha-galactosidase [Ilumatobacter coccineus]